MEPWQLLIALVFGAITGTPGHLIGKPKGYPVWGFSCGFLFSVIGLLFVIMSKPRKQGA